MAHLHSVYDTDTHFKVNDVTRKITDVSNSKTVIMQFDHNSERLTFEIPRYIDGHDMQSCNVVQVHYINVANNKVYRTEGVYEVDDFQISPEDENTVICSWLISQNATQHVGSLNFLLRFVCSNNGNVDYAWNTAIYTDIVVSDGMYNGDIIVEEYADVLEQWRRELSRTIELDTTLSIEGMAADAKAVGDALANINVSGGGGGTAVNIVQTTGDSETKVMSQKAVTEAVGAVAPLVVTITDNGDGTYTSSHTRKQIYAAFQAGRMPVAALGHEKFTLVSTTWFENNVGGAKFISFNANTKSRLEFDINGKITIAREEIALKSDIPDVSNISLRPFYLVLGDPVDDNGTFVVLGGFSGEFGAADVTFYDGAEAAMTALGDAYKAGRAVFARFVGELMTAEMPYDFPCVFYDFEERMANFGLAQGAVRLDIIVDGDFAIFKTTETLLPDTLPNPYSLTINGTAYDGSKAVSLTIQEGGGDNVPDYVRTEAERVAKVVQSRQNENTFTFIAASDIHFSTASSVTVDELTASVTHMGQAMKIIREQVHIDMTASLGDMVWDALDTPDLGMSAMRYVSQCLAGGHVGAVHMRARGNHDSLYSSNKSKGTGLLTDAQIFANIGAWNDGSVFDPENKLGGYCYRDFEDAKLRVIVLNSSETNTGGCLYSTKQITWLTDALDLSEKGDGWRSIILGHHPLDWSRDGGGTPITAVNGASGLICSFHGHTHNYLSGTVSGTSLPRLAIPNACSRNRENEYSDWGEATSYPKVHGTAEDTAFCVVTIDLAAHKIYADHYGAGYDREIDYVDSGGGGGSSYTNLVPTSQAADSTEPYNGTGYKNGVYLSSDGGDGTDTACVATGYIPYTWTTGNVLYVKGADVTTTSHVRIYGYATKGAAPNNSAICSGSTMDTYFTLEKLGDKYYKLTHKQAAGLVKYLRLSLIGTGANLIVTVNEPIE